MESSPIAAAPSSGTDVAELRERGFALHEQGDLIAAETIYREVLQRAPNDAEVNYALGVLTLHTGRYAAAVEMLGAAVAAQETAASRCYLGSALMGLSRLEEALHCYDRAVALDPRDAGAHLNRGQALHAIGRLSEALLSHERALELRPDFVEGVLSRARVHGDMSNGALAIADYDRAIALRPELASSYVNRSTLLLKQERWSEALSSVNEAIRLAGAASEALLIRALAQQGESLFEESLASYQRVLTLEPQDANAWLGSAQTLLALGRAAESLASADRALALRTPFPSAWFARAAALQQLGDATLALEALDAAVAERPDYAEALTGRAILLHGRGESRAAADDFKQALRSDPSSGAARIGLAIAQIPAIPTTVEEADASRDAFKRALLSLAEDLRVRPCTDPVSPVGTLQPFLLAYQERDNRELLALHGRICCDLMQSWRQGARFPVRASTGAGSKMRVAVISAHICRHSVYDVLIRAWLKLLDRKRFEVEVFHTDAWQDDETRMAQSIVDYYAGGRRSVLEWTRLVKARSPDVILYPEIGMDATTLQLASQRMAPVQAASWGHPQTTGLPTMDFFLSADAFEPPEADGHYTERLVRLPNLGCYYEQRTLPSSGGPAEPAIERSTPILVCGGAPFKYAPEHDRTLIEIARRLGSCQFHFFTFNDGTLSARLQQRLAAAFSGARLDPERYLVMQPWATLVEFHGFLQRADLMLDTLGFSGFNTVAQALECNLPVLSYRGRFLRGRLGSGILESMDLNELVADTPSDYVERAVTLVQNPQERGCLRQRIRAHLPRLFRDEGGIKELERFLMDAGSRVA
jgi:protein O-GlcNAc transferase